VAPDEKRVDRIRAVIDSDPRLTADLFRIATGERLLTAIGATE
jgi:hypothetical protein